MTFNTDQTVAMLTGTSFAAGLNVYATVATLGLLSRTGIVALPQTLDMLESWWIIGAALVLFGIEFFADKVPAFDLIWNALQTFVRIPVAALLAYAATSHLSLGMQLASAALGGLIAFAAHGGKIALRTAVTPSPEPFSNMALSLGEDAGAITLSWFAVQHPYVAASVVAILLIIIGLLIRWVVRGLRGLFRRGGVATTGA
ncbi:MAG: DUF4126 domain-containing protein [Candidatus Korobacteraceae bacterium]